MLRPLDSWNGSEDNTGPGASPAVASAARGATAHDPTVELAVHAVDPQPRVLVALKRDAAVRRAGARRHRAGRDRLDVAPVAVGADEPAKPDAGRIQQVFLERPPLAVDPR